LVLNHTEHEQCRVAFPVDTGLERKGKEIRHRKQEQDECWELCENLVRNPKVYTPLCPAKSEGCQTACSYRNSSKTAGNVTSEAVDWWFPDAVNTSTDYLWIDMEWPEPVSDPPVTRPHPIVYALLMREKNDAWQLIGQTMKRIYSMKHSKARFVPEFLIQAIDAQGVIAETVFYIPEMIFKEVIVPVPDVGGLMDGGTAVSIRNHNAVNLTYQLHFQDKNGDGLTAKLTWEHPQEVVAASGSGKVAYNIVYIRYMCGVYEDLPKCPYPDDLYSSEVFVDRDEKPEYTITQLLYNTGYNVLVVLDGDNQELVDIVLNTPRCHNPTKDFQQCRDPDVTEKPDSEPGYVVVNISWNFISDPNVVNFSVKIVCEDDTGYSVTRETVSGTTHVVAKLQDNTVYEAVVDVFNPARGGEVEFAEGFVDSGQDYMYLDESQQRKHFNTSELQLAAQEVPQAVMMQRQNMRAVNGVIIGVTCVGVLVVVGLIVLFLYRKRQSFRGIIIPKTTVAKSNSYKSSVGGKADYSNQLMVFSDEWELDPRQLKFSTPLGQGAFGKVVTGYCADQKVAIKLVKESLFLSEPLAFDFPRQAAGASGCEEQVDII
ncbi:hypothetical protein BaRGS_00003205, partial [Batillaria attramentaria]